MSARSGGARFARFGIFEADLHERTLHRNGLKVKLQNQPFEVLAALLQRPGETVSGEELSRRIWPDGVFVEFEHSLSTAVLKIRRVLDDSADNPRFIETVPRHGYRFIAPVELVSESRFAVSTQPASGRKLHWAIPPRRAGSTRRRSRQTDPTLPTPGARKARGNSEAIATSS
jgi:DNA-binding winged helix-turn-helix (wHTH) protein